MRGVVLGSTAAVLVALACSSGPSWTWPPADFAFADAGGVPFDPNTLIDQTASLTDPTSLPTEAIIEGFLMQTPYGGPSFLATYASNGLTAARAIAEASNTYQINPLVLIARAEMDQALVSLPTYPVPAARVEYAFGCGCGVMPSPTNPSPKCDPTLAGFDKQVECLASTLRSYVDGVCGIAGTTAGGWSQGVPGTTLDNVMVTPANAGTAVLYQYTPYVLQGATGGNWLLWNIYQTFAQAVGYPGAMNMAFVGDPCCENSDCQFAGGECAVNVPNGACTAPCDAMGTGCPTMPGRPVVCANLNGAGFCLPDCAMNACRAGYLCEAVALFPSGQGLACR